MPSAVTLAALAIILGACRTDIAAQNPPTSSSAVTSSTFAAAPSLTTTTGISTTSTSSTSTTTSTTTSTSSTTTTPTTTTTTTTTTTATTAAPSSGGSSIYDIRPASDIPAPPLPLGWSSEVIGRSANDRDITAWVRPVQDPRRRVLVIGGLHGNEPVAPPTVRGLVGATLPIDVEVWLVPEANPDGVAAGTRWNGNGVDLNRNFSWDWREVDGGPGPLSEPETQALTGLVERLRPDVVVWVHQPYGYVSSIGPTDPDFERAWSDGAGVPVRSGVTQHGGGESWSAFVAGVPSMLIEIDSWNATPEIVAAHSDGFEALVAALD